MQSLFMGLRWLHGVELHNLAEPRVWAALSVFISERLHYSLHQSWVEWRFYHSISRRLRLLFWLQTTNLHGQLPYILCFVFKKFEFVVTNTVARFICIAPVFFWK